MSETMSDREIEDVLNSVRRLVAQEERRSRLPRLVLTPEMRVDPRRESAPPPKDDAPPSSGDEAATAAPHPAAGLPDTVAPGAGLPASFDERALEDMVTRVVREELHGKLGERITLAVRKLVRNEIARALDEERRK